MRVILTLLLVFTLCACAQSGSPANPPLPLDSPELLLAKRKAVPCENPAPAQPIFHAGFKYGCFCGANHPVNSDASTERSLEGSQANRKWMIERYFSVKPFDDIDALCQAHDVCWTRYGYPNLRCNEELSSSLKTLESLFKRVAPSPRPGRPTNPARQCMTLIADIDAAAILVMESHSDEASIRAVQPLVKLVGWIGAALAGSAIAATRTQEQYPSPDLRCNVGRFVGSSEQ